MTIIEAHRPVARHRLPRLWIVESLVVLGVLAFGYFAVTIDASRWSSPQPSSASTDALLEELAR